MSLPKTCPCGSGLPRYVLADARGIACGLVCVTCEPRRRAQYRPEIFTDMNYHTDEPVDAD
jgi:hypothetical protein